MILHGASTQLHDTSKTHQPPTSVASQRPCAARVVAGRTRGSIHGASPTSQERSVGAGEGPGDFANATCCTEEQEGEYTTTDVATDSSLLGLMNVCYLVALQPFADFVRHIEPHQLGGRRLVATGATAEVNTVRCRQSGVHRQARGDHRCRCRLLLWLL